MCLMSAQGQRSRSLVLGLKFVTNQCWGMLWSVVIKLQQLFVSQWMTFHLSIHVTVTLTFRLSYDCIEIYVRPVIVESKGMPLWWWFQLQVKVTMNFLIEHWTCVEIHGWGKLHLHLSNYMGLSTNQLPAASCDVGLFCANRSY